jgi:hypothetical protein
MGGGGGGRGLSGKMGSHVFPPPMHTPQNKGVSMATNSGACSASGIDRHRLPAFQVVENSFSHCVGYSVLHSSMVEKVLLRIDNAMPPPHAPVAVEG